MLIRSCGHPQRIAITMLVTALGCTTPSSHAVKPWSPIPPYADGLDASAGSVCGSGPVVSSTTPGIAVDILIDSLGTKDLDEITVRVDTLPAWQRRRPSPVLGVTIYYPRPGASTVRESFRECDASGGATVRINAATIGRVAIDFAAQQPVRLTLRAIDGAPLNVTVTIAPGAPMQTLRWGARTRAA